MTECTCAMTESSLRSCAEHGERSVEGQRLFKGGVYEVRSRNLVVAAYDGEEGFIGIREKFGDEYLFTEYLSREFGGTKQPLDTVRPVAYIATLDEDIPLATRGEPATICTRCKTRAWFVQDTTVIGRTYGSWQCEAGCEDTLCQGTQNDVLFDILRDLQRPVDERIAQEIGEKIVPPWRQG